MFDGEFRMPGRDASELAEVFEIFHRKAAGEKEFRVEQGRHVARIHQKAVPRFPVRILRIELEKFRKEERYGGCRAHRSARMPGLCLFDHGGGKDSNVVGSFLNY